MARRATLVNQVRSAHKNVLLLDCGDAFSHEKKYPRLRAETIFQAMEKMGYDAINVADGELGLGGGFFTQLTRQSTISRLSLTLQDPTTGVPLFDPYMIRNIGGLRVAVIGMTSPSFFGDAHLEEAGATIVKGLQPLKELLSVVRKKSDVVILMSHLGQAGTMDLFRNKGVQGVDVAIVGHAKDFIPAPVTIGETLVLQNGSRGEYVGMLQLAVDEMGKISAYTHEMADLSSDIPDESWAAEMTREFRNESLKRDKSERKARLQRKQEERRRKAIEARKELLALPPEEALKRLPEFVETRKLY